MIGLLRRFRNFVIRQKIRIDFAMSLLVVVNLALLVITASDKLQRLFKIDSEYYTYHLVFIIVPAGIFCVWLVGFIIDKFFRYQQTVTSELNQRNPQIMEILSGIKRLEERLDKIEKGNDRRVQ